MRLEVLWYLQHHPVFLRNVCMWYQNKLWPVRRFPSCIYWYPNATISYGDGVYSCINPALANIHATSSTSSPYRVMLACDVLIADQDDEKQVDDGERVYVANADAIIPSFVILYKF